MDNSARYAALFPDIKEQFKAAAEEVTGDHDEPTNGRTVAGAAAFDGAPKPTPGDEFASVAYARPENDARTDAALMMAVGIAASAKREADDAPSYQMASMQPGQEAQAAAEQTGGRYASLKEEHAAVIAAQAERDEALFPRDTGAEFKAAAKEVTERQDALFPPDIRDELANRPNTRGPTNNNGLTM